MRTRTAKILITLICLGWGNPGTGHPDAWLKGVADSTAVGINNSRKVDPRRAVGRRIVAAASKDVGAQERTGRNDHPLFSYYRTLGKVGNKRNKQGKYQPYCAVAVNAWHRQAGVKPKPPGGIGRAKSWAHTPTKLHLGPRTGPATVDRLDSGMTIGFHFGPGRDHVGIIETPYPLYAVTIEGNTSLSKSIGHYRTRQDGVVRKIRWYKSASWAADWRDSPESDTLDVAMLRRKYYTSTKPLLLP